METTWSVKSVDVVEEHRVGCSAAKEVVDFERVGRALGNEFREKRRVGEVVVAAGEVGEGLAAVKKRGARGSW